ncbi:MAG: SurA N-terminal domain-containing protein [Alphaproteobacteria bacterium]|nr:SurA N-terminal domain-containing protein [Alphaproteobacteria bacterium]
MIKILLFALAITFSTSSFAQFNSEYSTEEAEEYDAYDDYMDYEQENPSVFRAGPQLEMPEPQMPQAIKKPTPYSGNLRILATVNGEIITTEDINNRVRAFCLTTGIPYNSETKLLIINKVMQNTIDEKIKMHDAKNNNIKISDSDIDNAIQTYTQNNKTTPDKLKRELKEFGVSEAVFREQMKSDIAWVRLIRNKTGNIITTEPEVQEALKVTKEDMSKKKFMVSEIVIPRKEAKNIHDLSRTLRHDPRFEMYAAQFSQSPSSSSGGRLGWINDGQLPDSLNKVLQKMSVNQVSDPILYNDSYYILKLEKKFDPAKDKMPEPSTKEITEMLQNQKIERFAAKYLQTLRQRAAIKLKE